MKKTISQYGFLSVVYYKQMSLSNLYSMGFWKPFLM